MAVFVLIVVGIVVAQTWFDWRDSRKDWVLPDWAKGLALAGVIAVCLTATTSFASAWLETAAANPDAAIGPWVFCIELGLVGALMAAIVRTVRKKKLRSVLLLSAGLAAAVWFGVKLLL